MPPPTPAPNNLEAQFAPETSFRHIGLPWRLLVFSLFLFGFALFVFFGLRFGYGMYLEERSKGIEKDIHALAGKVNAQDQENLVAFYSQLLNIERVLGTHRFSSNMLTFLETTTLGEIYYTRALLSPDIYALQLQGKARTVEDVTSQLSVFDASPEVSTVTLGNLALGDLEVGFEVTLTFKESFFEKLK